MEESDEGHLENLKYEHKIFSEKIMCGLLYYIELYNEEVENCPIFEKEMSEAAITLYIIFQREHRKLFQSLRVSLKNIRRFEEYCKLILVEKDELYFYNFLKRISTIFALAHHCFKNLHDTCENYFTVARKCIEEYPDVKYFEDAGGWESLKRISYFLAKAGLPLIPFMNLPVLQDGNIQTFSDAVQKMDEEFLFTGNLTMQGSDEMEFLLRLKDVYQSRPWKKRMSSSVVKQSPSKKNVQSEQDVVREYFEYCLQLARMQRAFPDQEKEATESAASSDTEAEKCPGHNLRDKITELEELVEKMPKIEQSENETSKAQEKDAEEASIGPVIVIKQHEAEPVESQEVGKGASQKLSSTDPNIDSMAETPVQKDENSEALASCSEDASLLEGKVERVESKFLSPKKIDSASSDTEHNFPEPKQIRISPRLAKRSIIEPEACFSGSKQYRLTDPVLAQSLEDPGSNETECGDKTLNCNFIIPEKYLFMRDLWKSDECKYLYSAKMHPPSKREKVSKNVKKALDANIDNKNCRQMTRTSGDILVGSQDLAIQEYETRILFLNSSTDESGDEMMDEIICRSKREDLQSERRKDEIHRLRPRKPEIKKDGAKTSSPSKGAAESKQRAYFLDPTPTSSTRLKLKRRSTTDTEDKESVPIKYLTKLFKKQLSTFVKEKVNTDELESMKPSPDVPVRSILLTPDVEASSNMEIGEIMPTTKEEIPKGAKLICCWCMTKTLSPSKREADVALSPTKKLKTEKSAATTVFIAYKGILAKRKVDLEEEAVDILPILGISENDVNQPSMFAPNQPNIFNPQPLSPQQDQEVNSYIRTCQYADSHGKGVCEMGKFSTNTKIIFLFSSIGPKQAGKQYHLDILRAAHCYKTVVNLCGKFDAATRVFIDNVHSELRRQIGGLV